MRPRVSICLPNLNTLPFLGERFDTIFGQTLRDWEMFVYDSYSDDGGWELIRQRAAGDNRIRITQGPREGPYPAWNECLRQTTAEFVYIATSDDTMAPDCLEKMVAALDRHQDCDLAHCPFIAIDERGVPVAAPRWPECTPFGVGLEKLMDQPHVHRAPYDGLLHLMGRIVYNSITQLLVRRSLFARIGSFQTRWGAVGDFNWEMRAGLVANTVHVPDTWASWRIREGQATAAAQLMSREHFQKVDEMIAEAFTVCEPLLHPTVATGLRSHWIRWTKEMRDYYSELREQPNLLQRRLYQVGQLFWGSSAARSQLIGSLLGRPKWPAAAPTEMRMWLESIGISPVILL